MSGSFRIAEGYVEVTADQSAYDTAMDRLKADRHQVTVNIDLDVSDISARLDELTRERTTRVTIDLDAGDATARLDELARERTAQVRIDLDSTPLAALTGHTYDADIIAVVDQAYWDRAKAKLDKLTADRFVQIRANVDTRVGAQEIQNLVRRRTARIGVDVDTRVAADEINNLTRRRTANIVAQAQTATARAQLDALARNRHMSIDVGVRGGALSSLTSSAGGIGILSSRIARLTALSIAASPAILGLAQTIIQMGPAAAVAAPAILSIGAAFAAIKIGTGGIGNAFKAAFAPAVSGGGAAAKATNAVADAQRGLQRATQNAADANRLAAQQVASAERDLTTAQRQALAAQKAINDARKQAARDLQDLNNNLTDAQFAAADAQNAVEDAATALTTAQKTGDPEAVARAQLAYDEAVQALSEQRLQVQRLTEDTKAANKAGVEGSDQVKAAKQSEADAVQEVADKTEALTNAQIQQARTAQQGADAILQAKEALDQANQSAGGAAGGVNAFAAAMAKLAPAAREFVEAVIAQRAAWTALKLDVQQRLFAGLGAAFTTMANATLPSLRAGLDGTATVLNAMAKNALAAATNLGKAGTLRSLFDGLNRSLEPLQRIPGQFVTALAQLGIAATPAFQRITDAAGRGADSIAQKLTAAFNDGRLTGAINAAVDLVRQLGPIIGNLGGIFGSLFKAANSSGAGFLNTLTVITGAINQAFADPSVNAGLSALFSTLGQIAKTAGPLLVTALQTIAPVLTALGPPVQMLVETLGTALSPIIVALGPVLVAAAKAVGALVAAASPLLTVVGQMIASLGPVLTPILGIITDLFVALAPVIAELAQSLLPPFQQITQTLAGVFQQLEPVLGAALQQLGQQGLVPIVQALGVVISTLVTSYADQFVAMFQQLLPIIPALIPIVVQLAQSIAQILLAVAPLLPQILMLATQLTVGLLPAILPLMQPIADLTTALTTLATATITTVVIPVLQGLITFLGGLKLAFQPAIDAVKWLTTTISGLFEWLSDHLVGHSVIPDMVRSIVSWLAGLPGKAVAALGNIAVRLGNIIADAARRMTSAISAGVSSAVSTIRGLPSKIVSALGNLSGVLYNSGQALMRGFIDGISSMVNAAKNAASNVLGKVKNFFPNSPAKEGPFSGSGWTYHSGVAVARDWAAGLDASHGAVTGAASSLLGAAAGQFQGAAFGGGLLVPGATLTASTPAAVSALPAGLDTLLSNSGRTAGGVTVNMTVNSLAMPSPAERKAWAKGMARDVNDALLDYNRGIKRPGVGR